jgi:murein L,D-transpeptidase YcbB/YkuD
MGRVAGGVQTTGAGLPVRLFVLVGIATLALAGCSDDGGDGELERAESRVSAKQEALSDARSELAAKTAAFCKSSATYITALDRYGDVLNGTAPTVGDVKDGGESLTQPREDVVATAEEVTKAQQDVAAAEKELAEASAALAAAQAKASAQPVPAATPTSASAAPLVSSATVNRVKQADADFTAAQQGITDQTPLKQASQQFNAAAVALEMSWLRLFAEAGCLTDEQQKQAEAAVRNYTSALQKSLADAGYYRGEIDGVYGPATVDAVKALQQGHGLPVTGTVDKATAAALQADLQAKGGAAAQQASASTAAVQQTLKLAGYWNGPVDGNWTPALTEALKAFQVALGVEPTGTVDAATIAALEHAIAAREPGSPSSTTTTPPAASPSK